VTPAATASHVTNGMAESFFLVRSADRHAVATLPAQIDTHTALDLRRVSVPGPAPYFDASEPNQAICGIPDAIGCVSRIQPAITSCRLRGGVVWSDGYHLAASHQQPQRSFSQRFARLAA